MGVSYGNPWLICQIKWSIVCFAKLPNLMFASRTVTFTDHACTAKLSCEYFWLTGISSYCSLFWHVKICCLYMFVFIISIASFTISNNFVIFCHLVYCHRKTEYNLTMDVVIKVICYRRYACFDMCLFQ